MQKADVAVLGAGIVGLSAALHLQARGREVVILDRHAAPGQETSFGNAGLIERSSIFPYFFPHSANKLIRYAFNLAPEAHYHPQRYQPYFLAVAIFSRKRPIGRGQKLCCF